MKRFLLVGALLLASTARDAAAQGFISPFLGATLTSPSPNGSGSKAGYGIAFGKLGKIVGIDAEIAYYPEILDKAANALAKSRAVMFSGDALIGPMIGPVKVYGALGAGDMALNVASLASLVTPDPNGITNHYLTINVGGGVAGFFTSHFGVRGDLRDIRAYGFNSTDFSIAGLAQNHFDFWRGTIGVIATF